MEITELKHHVCLIAYTVDDTEEYSERKDAFRKALGIENGWYFVDDYAEMAVNRGLKTPEQVIAIAMLVFQE